MTKFQQIIFKKIKTKKQNNKISILRLDQIRIQLALQETVKSQNKKKGTNKIILNIRQIQKNKSITWKKSSFY